MFRDHQITLQEFEKQALPYLNDLYRTARRLVRDRHHAEDAVQETYLQAWKSFYRFEPGTNCRAWLFAILFHVIQHHWRIQSLMKTVPQGEEILEDMPAYEPPVPDDITDEHLLAALDSVPRQFREVLLLADVQEFTYKEISDILKVPIGTVMSRLSRGRTQLHKALLPLARDRRIITTGHPQPVEASL